MSEHTHTHTHTHNVRQNHANHNNFMNNKTSNSPKRFTKVFDLSVNNFLEVQDTTYSLGSYLFKWIGFGAHLCNQILNFKGKRTWAPKRNLQSAWLKLKSASIHRSFHHPLIHPPYIHPRIIHPLICHPSIHLSLVGTWRQRTSNPIVPTPHPSCPGIKYMCNIHTKV